MKRGGHTFSAAPALRHSYSFIPPDVIPITMSDSDFHTQEGLREGGNTTKGGAKGGMENSSVLGAGERAGIARSWRVWEGKEWTRSRAAIVRNRPRRQGSSERSRRGSWGGSQCSGASMSPGGARPILMRWRRILSIWEGSVMMARTRMLFAQRGQMKGLSPVSDETPSRRASAGSRRSFGTAAGAPVSVRDRSGGSPLQAGALRPVVDRNCVAARRGEEQRETNDQSAG